MNKNGSNFWIYLTSGCKVLTYTVSLLLQCRKADAGACYFSISEPRALYFHATTNEKGPCVTYGPGAYCLQRFNFCWPGSLSEGSGEADLVNRSDCFPNSSSCRFDVAFRSATFKNDCLRAFLSFCSFLIKGGERERFLC